MSDIPRRLSALLHGATIGVLVLVACALMVLVVPLAPLVFFCWPELFDKFQYHAMKDQRMRDKIKDLE